MPDVAWLFLVGVVFVAVAAGSFAARVLQREVEPTVKAFSEFRAALQPAVVELRAATGGTRRRLTGGSERGHATRRR